MTSKDYLDPKGYWGDPSGNIRRMSGEQEIIALRIKVDSAGSSYATAQSHHQA